MKSVTLHRNPSPWLHPPSGPVPLARLLAGLTLLGALTACAPKDRDTATTSASTMNHEVTHFSTDVVDRSRTVPVLVDFWAPWCGPCRVLKPTLEKLAGEAGGRWVLVTVNVDDHPELARQFGIRGIPHVKLFSGGQAGAEFSGSMPETAVRQWLTQHLPAAPGTPATVP